MLAVLEKALYLIWQPFNQYGYRKGEIGSFAKRKRWNLSINETFIFQDETLDNGKWQDSEHQSPSLFYSWYANTQEFLFSFIDKSEGLGKESLGRALQSLHLEHAQFWLLQSDETGSIVQTSRHYHSFQVGNKGAVCMESFLKVWLWWGALFCCSSWIFM